MTKFDLVDDLFCASNSIFAPSPWTKEQFASQLCQENVELVYEYQENLLIGFIISQYIFDEAEILLLGVLPPYKKQGIASSLLQTSCERLKEYDVTRLFLEVRSQNVPTISFYNHHGFKEIGIRKDYYHKPKDDAVMMQLDI